MSRYITRITVLFEAESDVAAREFIAERMNTTINWEYVTIDNIEATPMQVPEPTLEELFDTTFDNQ
jgi:hypothetical protein